MRRVPAFLAVLAAASAGQPAAAEDRLVTACEVAVLAHATIDGITLRFPDHTRLGDTVRVGFTFETAGRTHSGDATCRFGASEPPAAPDLTGFSVMGREGAALFLIGQHAILRHFAPPADRQDLGEEPAQAPDGIEKKRPVRRSAIG